MEEVEEICSRIMIMDHGKTLAIGTNEELKAQVKVGERIRIDLGSVPQELLADVQTLASVRSARDDEGALVVVCENGSHNVADVLGVLRHHRLTPGRIWAEPPTLNDVFLEITGRELRD